MVAPIFPQITTPPQALAETLFNQFTIAMQALLVYANDYETTSGLTWGYFGGRWGGYSVADGTLTLTASDTNYVVVDKADGSISTSIVDTDWNDATGFSRVFKIVTGASTVTSVEDHRAGPGGVHGGAGGGGGGSATTQCFAVAVSDETTALATGTAKVTFRMPFAFTLTGIRASVTTAPTGSGNLTIDVNEAGASILSTKLTFDASEKTTTTAATPAVISDSSLADDAEITVDIDAVSGTITGAGLKLYLIGTKT